MFSFLKKKTVNKTVVALLPPLLGTFQEHTKILKKFLPNVTKSELAYAKSKWSEGVFVRFMSPIKLDNKSADTMHDLNEDGWHTQIRSIDEPSCDCDSYYFSRCCDGINLGLHTESSISVYDVTFPDSLISRGSFMEELTEDKVIPLTKAEAEHFRNQQVLITRRAMIVEAA